MFRLEKTFLIIGLSMFAFVVFSVVSWVAVESVMNPSRVGALGRVALWSASFPAETNRAAKRLFELSTEQDSMQQLSVPRDITNLAGFRQLAPRDANSNAGIPDGIRLRGDANGIEAGWFLLAGVMEIDAVPQHTAILLGPDLKVWATWVLSEEDEGILALGPNGRKFIHSAELLADGSIIFLLGGGFEQPTIVGRRDFCGNDNWTKAAGLHHSIAVDPESGSFWAPRFAKNDKTASGILSNEPEFEGEGFAQINVENGEVLRNLRLVDLINANSDLGIFQIASKDVSPTFENRATQGSVWVNDPFHFNDVEALPNRLAPNFPMFDSGDLLINPRDLNTILVVDPETYRIKWFHTGHMNRPHDPDWNSDGRITVFDNGMDFGRSRVIAIDPATHAVEDLTKNMDAHLYSRIQGRHTIGNGGNLFVTSSQQGEALIVSKAGKRVLEIISLRSDKTDKNFMLTQFTWLPGTALNIEELRC